MNNTNDEGILIRQMQEGNSQAFHKLYAIYSSAIRNNISRFIKDNEAIQDLLQEVFITLWENKEKIKINEGAAPWLYTVSRNKSLNYLRKKIPVIIIELTTYQHNFSHEDEADSERLSVIYEALKLLPERKKMAFYQYRIQGRSLSDIADAMGITKNTVKEYLKDAKKFIVTYVTKKNFLLLLFGSFHVGGL